MEDHYKKLHLVFKLHLGRTLKKYVVQFSADKLSPSDDNGIRPFPT